MTQSHRPLNEAVAPPHGFASHTDGESVPGREDTLHQIFETGKYIYSISSSLERLYRYTFDPDTNAVLNTNVFKRVREGDREIKRLLTISPRVITGTPTTFCGKQYDVGSLITGGKVSGYVLYASPTGGYGQGQSSEGMYFAPEVYEPKRS